MNGYIYLTFSILFRSALYHGMIPLTFIVGLPITIKLIELIPHTLANRYFHGYSKFYHVDSQN